MGITSEDRIGLARNYLMTWKNDRHAWKFNKNLQAWILDHWFDRKAISKSLFDEAGLEYLVSVKGKGRERLNESAQKILNDVEADDNTLQNRVARLEKKRAKAKQGTESQVNIDHKIKMLRSMYKRAKKVAHTKEEYVAT